ncbi:MAG: class I SAM-dependent methyltransferase [Anaerolineales bacterium]
MFGRRSHQMRAGALQHAGLKPGSRILDFGCGAGDLAFEAEEFTKGESAIVGIDPSPEMIKVARQKGAKKNSKVTFQVEAVEKMSFPDASFDVVTSSFVLHHLPAELQKKAFKELRRVLKSGGLFFAIDIKHSSSFASRIHEHLGGRHGSPVEDLRQAAARLAEAGFRHVEVVEAPSGDAGFLRGIAA